MRFVNGLNRFVENNQCVHESDTASVSGSMLYIIRSNDMFYEIQYANFIVNMVLLQTSYS